MEKIKEYFNEFLEIISENGEYAGVALLKGSFFRVDDEENVSIICSGDFAANHIKKDFLERIKSYLKDKCGHDINVEVLVDVNVVNNNEEENTDDAAEITVTTENNNNNTKSKSNLNEYFKFDNFIEGSNNKFVFAAAKLVAEKPGREYNPLYIYGSVGIGKTHLLQAIGNYYLENNPNAKVNYIDGSGFRDEYIYGLQTKKSDNFKKKYKSLDMFLLDDLQLLESAQETSKELFEKELLGLICL